MKIVELPISQIDAAAWNSNEMNESEKRRLDVSVGRFGLVQPIVVRKLAPGHYETIAGAQRLGVVRDRGSLHADCVIVDVDDASARLMSQALNHISGHENERLRAAQFREILATFSEGEVIEVLPESFDSLHEGLSIGAEGLSQHLEDWEKQQAARLRHRTFQLTDAQVPSVDQAIELARAVLSDTRSAAASSKSLNPNDSGNALHHICQDYLKRVGGPIDARDRDLDK